MIEYERRYRVCSDEFLRVQSSPDIEWSVKTRLTDVTFGPSGAESMQIDGWVLRLRKSNEGVALQFKAPANAEWTAWNEISINVDSAKATIELLQAIGMKTGLLLDRTRTIGYWGKYTVSLDEFALLGQFIEVEINSKFRTGEAPNFEEVLVHFGLETASECRPYGQLMLETLKNNPELRNQVGEYLKLIE